MRGKGLTFFLGACVAQKISQHWRVIERNLAIAVTKLWMPLDRSYVSTAFVAYGFNDFIIRTSRFYDEVRRQCADGLVVNAIDGSVA